MSRAKLMIIGHGRHGKDTVCELLRERWGYTFETSSWMACQEAVYPALEDYYPDIGTCYADRHNWRALWFNLIRLHLSFDKAGLARSCFEKADIYCGSRSVEEFEAIKAERMFDVAVWVDASDRMPPETSDSMTITQDMADITISNNGTEADLVKEIDLLAGFLREQYS